MNRWQNQIFVIPLILIALWVLPQLVGWILEVFER